MKFLKQKWKEWKKWKKRVFNTYGEYPEIQLGMSLYDPNNEVQLSPWFYATLQENRRFRWKRLGIATKIHIPSRIIRQKPKISKTSVFIAEYKPNFLGKYFLDEENVYLVMDRNEEPRNIRESFVFKKDIEQIYDFIL